MSEVINAYRGFSAAAIKAKATIPNQADMTVDGTTVLCINITTAKIRNAIGETINRIGGLNLSSNVNVWSGFGPTVRSIVAQTLVNSIGAAPHQAGEFAGYNHTAVTPGWKNAPLTGDVWVDNGGNAEMYVDVTVGEVKWHEVANGILGVVFAIYDGATLVAYVARNFIDENVTNDCTGLYAYVLNCTTQKTYTCKVWLVDATAYGFDDTQIVCRLPNTLDFTRTVKIKAASTAVYDDTGTNQPPSPWVNNNGGLGMNWTTGTVSIGYDLEANQSWTNVRVYAVLRNWLNEVIGQGDIFNDVYNSLDSVYGSVYLGMTNIPSYGYSVKVYIEYTI